jgi:hypothetical protein
VQSGTLYKRLRANKPESGQGEHAHRLTLWFKRRILFVRPTALAAPLIAGASTLVKPGGRSSEISTNWSGLKTCTKEKGDHYPTRLKTKH